MVPTMCRWQRRSKIHRANQKPNSARRPFRNKMNFEHPPNNFGQPPVSIEQPPKNFEQSPMSLEEPSGAKSHFAIRIVQSAIRILKKKIRPSNQSPLMGIDAFRFWQRPIQFCHSRIRICLFRKRIRKKPIRFPNPPKRFPNRAKPFANQQSLVFRDKSRIPHFWHTNCHATGLVVRQSGFDRSPHSPECGFATFWRTWRPVFSMVSDHSQPVEKWVHPMF